MGRLRPRVRGQGKKLSRAAKLWASGQLDTDADHDADEDAQFDAALAALGLYADASGPADTHAASAQPPDVCHIWPECVPLWNLWLELQTQWRVSAGLGGSGRTGLDYAGVSAWMRGARGLRGDALREALRCVAAMERAALGEWARAARERG